MTLFYLTCLAVLGAAATYDLPPPLAEFCCTFNGLYSDQQTLEKYAATRTPIESRVMPALVPALSQFPAIYVEQANEGRVVVSELSLVSLERDGVLIVRPYNVTDLDASRPGGVTRDTLKNLTQERLQGDPRCTAAFTRVNPFVFMGNWPDYRHINDQGHYRTYKVIFICDGYTFTVPNGAAENKTLAPYEFKRLGNKFQMEFAPDNYVCNCD
ncbi:hypothetical protein BsWGS_23730 [Bradybaena similaris]